MNQILITKKLYVTPELKRKKKIYKFDFMISIFLVLVLLSVYIYAEYDRNKSEEVSQSILEEISYDEEEIVKNKNKVLIAVLDASREEEPEENNNLQEQEQPQPQSPDLNSNTNQNASQKEVHSVNGYTYTIEGSIKISKIGIDYPILLGTTGSEKETEALLKSSPCKFHGPELNEVGNYCIVGHNYRNSRFFSKVPTLVNGDIIEITDLSKRTILYKVYDKHIVKEDDLQDTDQRTNGKKEITLITCTDASNDERYIIKARQV